VDTNQVAQLIALAKVMQGGASAGVTMTQLIIVALVPVLGSVAAWINSRATKLAAQQIHSAVNSERSAMIETVKELRDEILAVSKENATLREREQPAKPTP
jgi:hypothetical protein